jgi:hypothetical protein
MAMGIAMNRVSTNPLSIKFSSDSLAEARASKGLQEHIALLVDFIWRNQQEHTYL